ncbi:glutaredoxin-related protein 5, mitochondrial-like [Watersipora subatra]|uniref:glutaredoxin-related protein 5, mitochondrial-like n=1 Tax=Watersipora subatra TaxID=2589382 RepID=UPI00355C78FC
MFRQICRATVLRAHATRLCSTEAVQEKLSKLVKENKVVVFMKGTPDQPMCGFSRAVIQMLDIHEVGRVNYSTHDVLEDESIRQGIKDFTSWPTIPQVFIDGQFVGGCDIMLELHKSGELITELKSVGIKSALDDDDS